MLARNAQHREESGAHRARSRRPPCCARLARRGERTLRPARRGRRLVGIDAACRGNRRARKARASSRRGRRGVRTRAQSEAHGRGPRACGRHGSHCAGVPRGRGSARTAPAAERAPAIVGETLMGDRARVASAGLGEERSLANLGDRRFLSGRTLRFSRRCRSRRGDASLARAGRERSLRGPEVVFGRDRAARAKRRRFNGNRPFSRTHRDLGGGRSVACCPVRTALHGNSADARRLARAARRRLRAGGGDPRAAVRRHGRPSARGRHRGRHPRGLRVRPLRSAVLRGRARDVLARCGRDAVPALERRSASRSRVARRRRAIAAESLARHPDRTDPRNSVTNPLPRAFED